MTRCGPPPSLPVGCECIPPGDDDGQILVWDGDSWVPAARGEVIPAGTVVGDILVWNGAAWVPADRGEVIPAGVSVGQILVWDGSSWVPAARGEVIPAGTVVGQLLVWNGSAWVTGNPESQPGGRPWQGAWGTPNFGGQTLYYMQNVNWTGAVITAATLAANPHIVNYIFPKQGGKLKYIAAEIIGATVAPSQITTYTVWVDGVATALAVSLAAALNASDCAFVDVTIPAAAVNHRVMIQVTAPANPGSGATIPNRVHVGGWVNP